MDSSDNQKQINPACLPPTDFQIANFIWKDSISDGALPISRFIDGTNERRKKDIKKLNDTDATILEKGLITNIKKKNEKQTRQFKDGKIVYCKSLKCYVQVRNYDEGAKSYKCRLYTPEVDPFLVKCNASHVMKKIVGLPPGYGGARCDRCRAGSLERQAYLYHCPQCKFDLCMNCVQKDEAAWKEKNSQNALFEEEKEGEKEKMAREQLEKIMINEEDLDDTIQVQLSILNSECYEDEMDQKTETSIVKVSVEDKVDKLNTYLNLGRGKALNGFMVTQGKIIPKPEEVTFKRMNVMHMQDFSIICKSSTISEPKRWVRFRKMNRSDYMFMTTSYYDGIVFVPKKNVYFFGWGLFAAYRGYDQTFNIRWKIDDSYSDKFDVSFKHADRHTELNTHEIDIRNFGVQPIYCPAGTHINVLAYPYDSDMRRTFYGEQGRNEQREQIPDQENIFDIIRSPERYDSNEGYGQFPYILYAD